MMIHYQPPLRCKGGGTWCVSRPYVRFLLFRILFGYTACLLLFSNVSSVLADPYGGGSVGIHIPGGSIGAISEARCPRVCSCNGLTVDCSHRGLTQVPRKISADVERL